MIQSCIVEATNCAPHLSPERFVVKIIHLWQGYRTWDAANQDGCLIEETIPYGAGRYRFGNRQALTV